MQAGSSADLLANCHTIVAADTVTGTWAGERLDLAHAVSVLLAA